MNIERIIETLLKRVNKITKEKGYNKYIKSYTMSKMFLMMLYQQLSGNSYGRSFTLQARKLIGKEGNIPSQSELSKKLSYKMPAELFEKVYGETVRLSLAYGGKRKKKMLNSLRIIDSSHLSASLSMKWAKHRSTKNGLKIHLMINSDLVPEAFRIKNGRSSDKKSLRWAINSGLIYVFDRGYNDYKLFSDIQDKGAHFVTRMLGNAVFKVEYRRRIGKRQQEKGIISDDIISVIIDRKNNETIQFRRVTFKFIDARGEERQFSLLTNLMNNSSDEISKIYRERWNIEVVFRWLKMFLSINHWISRSINGVMIQLYSALIMYLIVKLAHTVAKVKKKILKDYCHEYLDLFLRIFRSDGITDNFLRFVKYEC